MNMLKFKDWFDLFEVVWPFGKFSGGELENPNQVPTWYLQSVIDVLDGKKTFTGADIIKRKAPPLRASIERELQRRKKGGGPPRQKPQAPDLPEEPVTPVAPRLIPKKEEAIEWWYARSIKKCDHFDAEKDLAMLPLNRANPGAGSWNFRILGHSPQESKSGVISAEEAKAGIIKAYRDKDGKPLKSVNPSLEDLYDQLGLPMPTPQSTPEEEAHIAEMRKKHVYGWDKLSEEQQHIDKRFEGIMTAPKQSHIMIDAKAGTGKTTMLKHLAWKYGKPGQRWLYLVFNTKNKVEAKGKFPQWVHVATTNGFLGEVMKLPQNHHLVTKRIAELKKEFGNAFEEDEQVGKAELLVNGDKFIGLLRRMKFPIDTGGTAREAADAVGLNETGENILKGFIERAILEFQKNVVTFVGLVKNFAVDPRKPNLQQELQKIYDSYGPLPEDPAAGNISDSLPETKGAIAAFKASSWKDQFIEAMNIAFGTDFMRISYKKELFECVTWMMQMTMPPSVSGVTEEEVHVCKNKAKYASAEQTQCGEVWVGEPRCPKCGARSNITSFPLSDYRDFDDDFWFPAIFANDPEAQKRAFFPKYDYVLADEVQDFNECQKIILVKLHERGAKIVAVGDPFQGIYRFRGADAQAFKNLGTALTGLSDDKDVVRTLTKNFRSRRAPLDWVTKNTIVKELAQGKHLEDEYQGETSEGTIKYEDVFKTLFNEFNSGGLKKQTAFIARTNEPLAHAAFKLLIAGIPFVIIGKDVAGGLRKHIKKVMNNRWMKNFKPLSGKENVDELAKKVEAFLEQEVNKFKKVPVRQAYLKSLDEISKALLAAINQYTEGDQPAPTPGETPPEAPPKRTDLSIAAFQKWLSLKLGGLDWDQGDEGKAEKDYEEYQKKLENKNTVILTTAHKSKGLEYERVYILRYDQFPHPKAKRPEDKEQEENAKYVSATRAMDELHIVALDGQPGYNK